MSTRDHQPPERLGELFRRYFGPDHGIDLELPSRELHEPVDLTEPTVPGAPAPG